MDAADVNNGSGGGSSLASLDEPVLVTGANGFIGSRVVQGLLERGFRNLVCFVRPSGKMGSLEEILERKPAGTQIKLLKGNLLSREDCENAAKGVALVYHLAAGIGEKSFPNAFMNSVVATRNLLDACRQHGRMRRFVLVSSFAVYSNRNKPRRNILDETCPIEKRPELRGEAYCFAKIKQEELVKEYGRKFGIPYVVVRPGSVYGPGKEEITGRVGINTFGFFLHMGGFNSIPFTFVDNCADAIILTGIIEGVNKETFNVVDDDVPSSWRFLRMYKTNVKHFHSIYVPHWISYGLCCAWERYSDWSQGQLPLVFNRSRWHAEWKSTRYSNEKLKAKLGWKQKVPTAEAMRRSFERYTRRDRNA